MSVDTPGLARPTVPSGTITLQAPPEIIKAEGSSNALMTVMPMLGSVGSIAMISLGGGGSAGPMRIIMGGGILVASLGFVVMNLLRQRGQHKAAVTASRREYLAYLADLRTSVRNAANAQLRGALWDLPEPHALTSLAAEGSRVASRNNEESDFLLVRVGTGEAELCLDLLPPDTAPLAQLDPVSASAAHRFLLTHSLQPDIPTSLDLRLLRRIELAGSEEPARALARAMITHLTTFVSPSDLLVAVVASPAARGEWEWVKWLPHAWSPLERDATGPRRLVVGSLEELNDLLPITGRGPYSLRQEPVLPQIVVVIDGGKVRPGHPLAPLGGDIDLGEGAGMQGVTVIDLPASWGELIDPYSARLLLRDGAPRQGDTPAAAPQLELLRLGHEPWIGQADQLSITGAEATARRLTRYAGHGSAEDDSPRSATSAELVDLLGIGDVRDLDVAEAWRPRTLRDKLRVPIGQTDTGALVHLDIKESAQQGMGPHGLIIGATGSGKSEVLRTLVLALAMTHSSEDLNFVLVDFKGGATFAGMAGMPHVSAIITNLGEELSLVDRMQDALQGEMTRRQELLRSAGNFTNVTEYEKARKGGRDDLAPLPALLIVCDEFSELLSAKPEFTELFVAIGRLGRSLQMHLLLSSQRLEEGRLRGLESHLSYRIGLRTFSAAESRTVLGVPDAYTLPGIPGIGYLKPDTTTMIKFRAAYVSGQPPQRRATKRKGAVNQSITLSPFTIDEVKATATTHEAVAALPTDERDKRATFDIAVEAMTGRGPAAHQVWLPPLEVPPTFDLLAPDLVVEPGRGLFSPGWRAAGELTIPLGVVDLPLEQRRETLQVSLAGAGGNVAGVGGPRTGKSPLRRSAVTALALTQSPLEAQIFVLDFGGGTFAPFKDLAHVAGVATRSEPDVVRRTIAEITSIVNARELFFRANGVDSIETYRQRRAAGKLDDGYGDLFLVIDGWSTIRAEFEDLESVITTLAGRGLTFGLHVLIGTGRWLDFRSQMKDVLGTRLELRLGDVMDSDIDRKVAVNVPVGRPGRGIVPTKHHMLTALPRIDGSGEASTLGEGVLDLIETVNSAWDGPTAPKLRLLPEHITLEAIHEAADTDSTQIWLGIDEASLSPVGLDPRADPHLYLFGDSGSGKSAFLRGYAQEVQRLSTPKQAQIFAVDYRRSLLGEVPDEYLAGYLTTAEQAKTELDGLAQYLRTRLPGPDITPAQLRARSWWTGAEVYLFVDDYDLVATSMGNPLASLIPLLAQAGDVGLHVVVTRRSGGASRAMYDPLLQNLRDLAAPGILLSGSPEEGQLLGKVKARPSIPGRAQLVTRSNGHQVVQLAWSQQHSL